MEPLEHAGTLKHVLVAIPTPITSYTDDQLRAVKNLVEPILIKGRRRTDKHQLPVRVLDD